MKNIGIIGCGWLGFHLATHLSEANTIITTTRSEVKKAQLTPLGYKVTVIDFSNSAPSTWDCLDKLDVIIITVPFSKRNDITTLLHRFSHISQFIKGYNKQLFMMSSTGIYPETALEVNETTYTDNLLEPHIIQIENFIKHRFPQVNILRLGGLMGKDRVFSNYNPQSTLQVVNHIHYEDICLIIEQMILQHCTARLYNVVAPLHPTKQEVLLYQKGIPVSEETIEQPFGKLVLSTLLQHELNYKFVHPDPNRFI